MLVLLGIAVSLPAAFGAATMRWSAATPSDKQVLANPPEMVVVPSGRPRWTSSLPESPVQARVDTHLSLPVAVNGRLDPPAGVVSDEGFSLVGRLPNGLAFASDPSRGLLLAAGADGSLRWYDAKTLRPVGGCLLPGAAYQLAFDGPRGLLYAALSVPDKLQLGPLGDRYFAVGDIHVFDLDRLLGLGPAARARASKVIACDGHVWAMHLSPDRESLHYLVETSHDVQLVCADVFDRKEPKALELRTGGVLALTLTPDGKTLFGLAGGRVFAVDVDDWSFRWSLLVGGNVVGLTVGPGDMLYVVERRVSLYLIVVDPSTQRAGSRYALGVEGRASICRSTDGRHVYISNSAVTSGRILAFEAGEDPFRPRLVAWARSDRDQLIRGGIRLSDDGRFLLTGVGQLFRVGS